MQSHHPRPALPLFALALAYFTLGTASLCVVGLAPFISSSLGVTPAATGLLVTAFALTFAVCAPLAQSLVGHLPRKALLLGGLALLMSGLVLSAAAPSFAFLLCARVLAAAGASVVGPVASAIGSLLVPGERRARALAAVFAGFTLSSVIGVPLAAVLGPVLGWRGALLAIAVLSGVAALLVWSLVPTIPGSTRVSAREYRDAFTAPFVRPALLITVLQMAAPFTVYAVIGAYLAGRFAADTFWLSATLLGFGIGGVLGNAAVGALSRRLNGGALLRVSMVASAVVAASLLVLPRLPILGLVTFTAWSFFANMFQAPQQARLIGLNPRQVGLMLALNAAALYFGLSVGSLLASTLLPRLGVLLLALPALVMLIAALLLDRFAQKRSDRSGLARPQ